MEFKKDPSEFGFSMEVAKTIHQAYVEEENSMDKAIQVAMQRCGEKISLKKGREFIRQNGWVRSQRFYAKRGPWAKYNQARWAQTLARLRLEDARRGDG